MRSGESLDNIVFDIERLPKNYTLNNFVIIGGFECIICGKYPSFRFSTKKLKQLLYTNLKCKGIEIK